jgi:nucleoid DNA-binding protein
MKAMSGFWPFAKLYRRDCEKIVSTIFAEITAAMARGDRVELRGFGSFFVRFREARTGKTPRTEALVLVGRKRPFLSDAGFGRITVQRVQI